jgi:SAM-dependent methyltransferase
MEQGIAKIYQDGNHYDRLFPTREEDLAFWIEEINRYGDPVLEIGCGTGRVSIRMAQAGFKVTGLDNSGGMLEQARKKSELANVEIQWVKADMRHFDLGGTFPLIIFPANTICHLITLGDLESCLSCITKHLAPQGRFIIDVFVPKPELLIDQPDARLPFSEYQDPDGNGKVTITHSYIYEPDTQVKRIKTYHQLPGKQAESIGSLDLRMYFPHELDALLNCNGFLVEHKYGSTGREGFNSASEKQLIVCSAKVVEANH